MTKQLPLTQGKVAIVDDADYGWLNQSKWYFKRSKLTGYAMRDVTVNGRRVRLRMHRLIMNPPDDAEVDHIDGDGCNNQRSNLRVCTHQENCQNNRRAAGATSSYRGVSFRYGRWHAVIAPEKALTSLGSFLTEEDAARAFDSAAYRLYGEFAKLNFPDNALLTEESVEALRQECREAYCSSRYYGVRYVQGRDVWEAYISVQGRQKYIKRYKTEVEAALAYNEAATKYYGDNAKFLNVILEEIP